MNVHRIVCVVLVSTIPGILACRSGVDAEKDWLPTSATLLSTASSTGTAGPLAVTTPCDAAVQAARRACSDYTKALNVVRREHPDSPDLATALEEAAVLFEQIQAANAEVIAACGPDAPPVCDVDEDCPTCHVCVGPDCAPASFGEDPKLECGSFVCDGAGACFSSCSDDTQCKPGFVCDGSNNCVPA